MDTCHCVLIVIRIMNKNNVRPFRFQMIFCIFRNWHISRKFPAFIVPVPWGSIRFPVKIRNGNHPAVTVRRFFCRHPYTFQGIPHRRLVRQKHDLIRNRYIIFYAVPYLKQLLIHQLHAFLGILSFHILIKPPHKLTQVLQLADRCRAFPFCFLDFISNSKRCLLHNTQKLFKLCIFLFSVQLVQSFRRFQHRIRHLQ